MPSFAFNNQVDRIGYYAGLPGSGSSWQAVLLRSAGLEVDDVLADYDDLASLLLGPSDEAIFAGYERKTVTPTRAVRDATNDVAISVPDLVWTKAGSSTGGQNDTLTKVLWCYKPTSTSADSAILPLIASQIYAVTDGNDMRLRNPTGLITTAWRQEA